MTVTIEVAPQNEGRLKEQAQRAGLPVPDFVAHIVDEQLAPTTALEEEEWEALLRSETVNVPPIAPENLRRENLYRDEE